jgi:hypothetical protein
LIHRNDDSNLNDLKTPSKIHVNVPHPKCDEFMDKKRIQKMEDKMNKMDEFWWNEK